MNDLQDAVVIGAGFYGAVIALYLSYHRKFKQVVLVDREPSIMARASYHNQARVHNGYHYPRSFTTAYRSRLNFPQFARDWPDAIKQNFTKLYAIARRNSKVTARQFERFCRKIGAKIQLAAVSHRDLFNSHLVEEVFQVEEYVFDSGILAEQLKESLEKYDVQICLETCATEILKNNDNVLQIVLQSPKKKETVIPCRYIFNCTYSGLNQFRGNFPGLRTCLKQEIAEMALVNIPPVLQGLGITVMDGPFFSLMPFPAQNLYTLSHVRYTPHFSWQDEAGINPYERLSCYPHHTRMDRMLRDASRYLPVLSNVEYVNSLFEIKTVLDKNESDDGRPILFEKYPELPGCYSILGGKIDNIYDILEKLETELLGQ